MNLLNQTEAATECGMPEMWSRSIADGHDCVFKKCCEKYKKKGKHCKKCPKK